MNQQFRQLEQRDFYGEGSYQVMTSEFLLNQGHCCHSGCRHCPYKIPPQNQNKKPRIICLVPSLTETLIAAGAEVVGCTRYCIHPEEIVNKICKVGGTKDLKINEIINLKADFVILDQEENTLEMANSLGHTIQQIVTHVVSIPTLAIELNKLSVLLNLPLLQNYSERLIKLNGMKSKIPFPIKSDFKNIIYIIWKDPWISVARETFIGSVLDYMGWGDKLWTPPKKNILKNELYPQFQLSDIPPNTLLLFSSEPYPFAKQQNMLKEKFANFPYLIVDGESYSWFGLRSLRFLEDQLLS